MRGIGPLSRGLYLLCTMCRSLCYHVVLTLAASFLTEFLAHPRSPMPPLSTLTARATHALPLHPAEFPSVPYGIVIVQVRVRVLKKQTEHAVSQVRNCTLGYMEQAPSSGHEASPQSGLGVGYKRCSSCALGSNSCLCLFLFCFTFPVFVFPAPVQL